MKKALFRTLLICFLSFSESFAEEFDFGEEGEYPAETSEQGFRLPLRGKAAVEFGRQTGEPERWIKAGPFLSAILDLHESYGTLHGELTARHNRAFRLENDPPSAVDGYENEVIFRELYLKKSFPTFTFTVGQKITVWGKSDFLSVLDVVTPLDQTEFLFASPEEARLGQLLAEFDVWLGKNELNVLFSPWPLMNRNPGKGHPYSLFPESTAEEGPGMEFGIRWNRERKRGAFSFLAGSFHERDPLFMTGETGTVFKKNEAFFMMGASLLRMLKPVLVKFEAAWFSKKPYQFVTPGGFLQIEKVDTFALSGGVDYANERFGSLTAEANYFVPETTNDQIRRVSLFSLSWFKSFYRDTLDINLTGTGFRSLSNLIIRTGVSFQMTDNIELTSQYTFIQAGAGYEEYRAFAGFDRFDLGLSYSFDLE